MTDAAGAPDGEARLALAAGVVCYLVWGGVPLLFMAMARAGASPWEIVGQRIVWAPLWAGALVLATGRVPAVLAAVRTPKVLGLLALSAATAGAHHSYSMFDRSKTVTIEGTVWTWEMINPHSFLWVVVRKPDGTTDKWGMEGAGVQMLQRAGVTKSAVRTGDKVTVDLHPLRDGRTGGQLVRVVLADGKVLGGFGGGGQNGAPE